MKPLRILIVMALGIVLAMGVVACGSGGSGGSPSVSGSNANCINVNGTWDEHIKQTAVCVGTPTEYDSVITITQSKCDITVNKAGVGTIASGVINNNSTFKLDISYEENGGTTSGTCEGTISNDVKSINLSCTGQWSNGEFTCGWAEDDTLVKQ